METITFFRTRKKRSGHAPKPILHRKDGEVLIVLQVLAISQHELNHITWKQ